MARIRHRLETRCAFPLDGSRGAIVVGCSGGPDSTALLLLFAALASRARSPGPVPIAVAVHHGLRPEASAECELVSQLAARLGLVFEELHVRPADRKGNLAANARHDRYAALADAARRHGAQAVAVGHHALDRFESTLLAIARGKGLRGVASPQWSRPLGSGIRLLRPLLDTTKTECEALCARFDIRFAQDPTNADPTRARGMLRREVIPALLERWPGLALNAAQMADEAAMAVRALDHLAARSLGVSRRATLPAAIDRARCRAIDPTLLAWGVRSWALRAIGPTAASLPRVTWERIARAATDERTTPRTFALGDLSRCRVTAGELRLERTPSGPRHQDRDDPPLLSPA